MKKLLFSVLSALIVLFSFVPYFSVAKAADNTGTSTWYNQSFQDWYGKVYDTSNPNEIFGERYTAAQVQWIIYGLVGFLINTATGTQGTEIINCLIKGAVSGAVDTSCLPQIDTNPKDTSVMNNNSQSLASLVFADRPMSGISYVREKIHNFRLIPTAHAATVGFGFDALKPIQEMWRIFRDIAYGLFVIVAVVFAFMVMFRVKLSPQTVISVQSALPKIIVALILVTFSYAIAGFLIDFMYIVIGFFSIIASKLAVIGSSSNNVGLTPSTWFNFLTLGQPVGFANFNIQLGIFGLFTTYVYSFTLAFLVVSIPFFGLMFSGVSGVLAILLLVIMIIVAIFVGVKTIWALIKAFANVILLTIFAPIQITLGSLIPNLGFGSWLKSYLSNLSVFVVTGVLMLFSFIFLFQAGNVALSGATNNNPLLDVLLGSLATNVFNGQANYWPPLLGASASGAGMVFLGVSFVLFTLIPKATQITQGFISGKPFAYGTAVGEAFGGVGMAYQNTIGPGVAGIRKYQSEETTMNMLRSLNRSMEEGRLQGLPRWIKTPVKNMSGASPFHRQ